MSTSRYTYTQRIGGERIATSDISSRLYFACQNGTIGFSITEMVSGERLDHIAAKSYGDSLLWWVIAAASGIGWSVQCPPGTVLRIPTDLSEVYNLLR